VFADDASASKRFVVTAQPTVIATKAPPASGCLFVLAAPSGGGKTSLVRALLEREGGIRLSISFTTRPPRPGERDGVDYHFVDEPQFMALKSGGEFLEFAHVHGNWYATSATWLRRQVEAGDDVLLEIDWQGAAQVRQLIPSTVGIFVLPPSLQVLKERLERRGQDTPAVIARRLEAAVHGAVDPGHLLEVPEILRLCAPYIHRDYVGDPPLAFGTASGSTASKPQRSKKAAARGFDVQAKSAFKRLSFATPTR